MNVGELKKFLERFEEDTIVEVLQERYSPYTKHAGVCETTLTENDYPRTWKFINHRGDPRIDDDHPWYQKTRLIFGEKQ